MSTEAKAQTVALAANWLSTEVSSNANAGVSWTSATASAVPYNTGNTTLTIAGGYIGDCWWPWPSTIYQPYYVPVTTYVTNAEKIKLKSGEVERLRKAAQRDAKLKAILNKFTPLIEVELEF